MKLKSNNKEYIIERIKEIGCAYYIRLANGVLISHDRDHIIQFGEPGVLKVDSSDIQCLIDHYSYDKEKKVLFDIV